MLRSLCLPILALGACAVTATEVALPPSLAGGETLAIEGVNGGLSGRVRVGAQEGTFQRTRRETTALGTYESDVATTRLNLTGPDLARPIEVDCRIERRAVTSQGVSIPTQPTAYDCVLSRGGALVVEEKREVAGPYPFPVRLGRVTLDGTTLSVRSLHDYAGIEREALEALGYSFADGDTVVGAVSLLMPPRLTIAPGADEGQRAAMIAASAALAITWEPSL